MAKRRLPACASLMFTTLLFTDGFGLRISTRTAQPTLIRSFSRSSPARTSAIAPFVSMKEISFLTTEVSFFESLMTRTYPCPDLTGILDQCYPLRINLTGCHLGVRRTLGPRGNELGDHALGYPCARFATKKAVNSGGSQASHGGDVFRPQACLFQECFQFRCTHRYQFT